MKKLLILIPLSLMMIALSPIVVIGFSFGMIFNGLFIGFNIARDLFESVVEFTGEQL